MSSRAVIAYGYQMGKLKVSWVIIRVVYKYYVRLQ